MAASDSAQGQRVSLGTEIELERREHVDHERALYQIQDFGRIFVLGILEPRRPARRGLWAAREPPLRLPLPATCGGGLYEGKSRTSFAYPDIMSQLSQNNPV